MADYHSRLISNSAEAPDYPRLLRSYRTAVGFVPILEDVDQYDLDLLQMAEKGVSDTEYYALIKTIKKKQLPSTTPNLDLSVYNSVFGDLSLQETPARPIVILQGNIIVIPISARKDGVAALQTLPFQ